MALDDLCFMTAKQLSQLILGRQVSVSEVMKAHLAQVERVNPKVNAIVTLVPHVAMDCAENADRILARNEPVGPLFGLPIAHKDLEETRGLRTTFGSPIYRDFIPIRDSLIVERLKKAGAITIGKTNTPEFGAGSNTFNEVFGITRNPYDTDKTCGGSSGGAAVALACGMVPIADGSDMGGSLRNPANFCNVVGFRTSPGRIPYWPRKTGWFSISVQGPMARTVEDAAFMLSAIAGPDPRSPIAIREPGSLFSRPLVRDFTGVRVAWSADLGGLPVDPRVTSVIDGRRSTFESLGLVIEDAEPDFSDADFVFKTLRAWNHHLNFREELTRNRDRMKDTLIWNIEAGEHLRGIDVGLAEQKRTQLYHRIREFMETREFMIFPVSQVPPFDVGTEYVTRINGTPMTTYIDWMKSSYYVSVVGLPSISVPCGFTDEGLPVGVQIVGRHQDDWGVLQLAYAFQEATSFWKQRPPVAVGPGFSGERHLLPKDRQAFQGS
jgi:amidase